MNKVKSLVIKLGTSTLTNGTKNLSRRSMLEIARQAAFLHEGGKQVILVTSGAVAAGREVLHTQIREDFVPSKQMLAAVGQVRLMQIWTDLFSLFQIPVGQMLLTRSDFSNRQRYLNVRDTLHSLLKNRVIPIINENDTVVTKENRVGDNDNLSALVANLIAAQLLVILTDQEGLFDDNPHTNKQAQLVRDVDHIDERIFSYAGGAKSGLGTGGMITKIQAAKLASHSGTPTVIASAQVPEILLRLSEAEKFGTYFQAEMTPKESRKRWLLAEKPQGAVMIDSGAEERLLRQGASLLPAGIRKVSHKFERGALIELVSGGGNGIAVGLSNYSSYDIEKLAGMQSQKIADILGYTYGPEVIHRDNMVLLRGRHG